MGWPPVWPEQVAEPLWISVSYLTNGADASLQGYCKESAMTDVLTHLKATGTLIRHIVDTQQIVLFLLIV